MSNPHFLRSSSPTTAPYRSRTGRAAGVRNVSPHEATYGAEISKIEADLRPCAEKSTEPDRTRRSANAAGVFRDAWEKTCSSSAWAFDETLNRGSRADARTRARCTI